MIIDIIQNVLKNHYNITIIDHHNQQLTHINLNDIINGLKCDLSQFDSVVMAESTYKAIKSDKRYKPAKSTIIITEKPSCVKGKGPIGFSDYSTLSCKFANPRLFADLFIDKVELTFPLDKGEAKKLYKELYNSSTIYERIKFKMHSNARAVKFHHSFIVTRKKFGSLHILLTPVSANINELKVSYNPSNYNIKDIKVFIKKLKKLCGNSYTDIIKGANITRFDITFDSDGYLVENILFNIDSSSYFKMYISSDGTIESIISGADGCKRAQFYDKTSERIKKGALDIDPSAVNTRFEITMRPHNINGLKLGKVNKNKDLWGNLNIYDYVKCRALIGENTVDWEVAKYFGIAALRRTKNNTDRVKLGKILNECKLEINESEFNQLIQERLSDIYRVFIDIK